MQIDSKNTLSAKELSFLISRQKKMVRNNLKLRPHKKDDKRQIIKDLLDSEKYYDKNDYFNDLMSEESIFGFEIDDEIHIWKNFCNDEGFYSCSCNQKSRAAYGTWIECEADHWDDFDSREEDFWDDGWNDNNYDDYSNISDDYVS